MQVGGSRHLQRKTTQVATDIEHMVGAIVVPKALNRQQPCFQGDHIAACLSLDSYRSPVAVGSDRWMGSNVKGIAHNEGVIHEKSYQQHQGHVKQSLEELAGGTFLCQCRPFTCRILRGERLIAPHQSSSFFRPYFPQTGEGASIEKPQHDQYKEPELHQIAADEPEEEARKPQQPFKEQDSYHAHEDEQHNWPHRRACTRRIGWRGKSLSRGIAGILEWGGGYHDTP